MEQSSELLTLLERIADAFNEQNRINTEWIRYARERDRYLDKQAERRRQEDIERAKEVAERAERQIQAMQELHSAQIQAAFDAGRESIVNEVSRRITEQE